MGGIVRTSSLLSFALVFNAYYKNVIGFVVLTIAPRSLPDTKETISMDKQEIELQLPRDGTLVLKPATDGDGQFLLSVYASTRADELAQVKWQEGQQEAFVKWQFELQRREYDARFPDAEYYVILIDNCPAGRIWIGTDAEQIRLLDIALLPEFQNRGAGTLLLRRLIDQAESTNKPLRHMVFVLNNDAHRFYERLGFKIIEDLGAYKHMEWRPVA